MSVASCLTALGALCGQLTFRLAWCQEHSAVTATELLQPLDLTCGTLFRSSCAIQTSPTDCLDDSWRDTFLGKHEHGALWLLICWRHRKPLTYWLIHRVLYWLALLSDHVQYLQTVPKYRASIYLSMFVNRSSLLQGRGDWLLPVIVYVARLRVYVVYFPALCVGVTNMFPYYNLSHAVPRVGSGAVRIEPPLRFLTGGRKRRTE